MTGCERGVEVGGGGGGWGVLDWNAGIITVFLGNVFSSSTNASG